VGITLRNLRLVDTRLLDRYQTQAFVNVNPLLTPSCSGERFESLWPALGIGVVFGNWPPQDAAAGG
jgi:hypothetical protein